MNDLRKVWGSTDCQQALESVLVHASTEVDPCVERAETVKYYSAVGGFHDQLLRMTGERSHPGIALPFSSAVM